MLRRAAAHKGTAFVEIYQNCNIFNDGAFDCRCTPRTRYSSTAADLPDAEASAASARRRLASCRRSDEHARPTPVPSLRFALSRITHATHGEAPFGVFRDVERPVYDELMAEQIAAAKEKRGEGDLRELLHAGDTWTIA